MSHSDMEMWTLSQVESFFLEQAHPDWARWDLLESVCDPAISQASSPEEIHTRLVGTSMVETFPIEVISGMWQRLQEWRVEDAHESNGLLEAALVNSY
jgi:hypothetical protein